MKKFNLESPTPEPAPPSSLVARLRGFDPSGRGLAASGMSVIVAGALLTGVVPGINLGQADSVTKVPDLPTFDVVPFENGDPILPDDGLTHLIVTPTTERLEHAATAVEVEAPDQPSGSAGYQPTSQTRPSPSGPSPSDDDRSIANLDELEALRNAPDGSSLVVTASGIAVRYPDGTIVALDDVLNPPDTAPAVNPEPAVSSNEQLSTPDTLNADPSPRQRQLDALEALPLGATMTEQLASLPGVDSVNAIGDGSYSVALSDPAALDGLAVEVTEQTYFALFAEPYERYEWYIENDGATMTQFGMSPTLDADVDGTVAIDHATGNGVVVAVVDTGVDFSHPDLAANKWDNPGEVCANGVDDDGNGYVDDCHGFDFVYRDGTGYNTDAHAHGTHVAGTIAAARNSIGVAGVAPGAKVMDLNVSTVSGSLAEAAISEAVRYAADNGADVINMSLGTKPGGAPSASISAAIDYAGGKGVLVVVAAGNDNTNLDVASVWPASYDKANMMTVGATSADDTKASFSNYGSAVDVFAPGHTILATVPVSSAANPYNFMSGTSMATPVVVGAAALVLSDDPSLTPQQVIAKLQSTSDVNPALTSYGANGQRVNAGEALGGPAPDNTPITELAVTMTGLGNLTTANPFTSSIRFAVPDEEFDEDFRWEMALLSNESSGVYALVDFPVELTGSPTTTGQSGYLDLGVTGTSQVTLSASLPAGDYGMVFEAIPTADPTSRLGNPFAVAFSVRAAANDQADDTSTPDSGTPDTGTPDNGTPDSGTGSPGTTTPVTSPPATSNPGTTQPGNGTGDSTTPSNPATGNNDGAASGGTGGGGGSDGATGGNTSTPDTAPADPGSGGTSGGGSATTTTAPNNGGTGNQPSPPASTPDPVQQGNYSIQTISPYFGPVGEQTYVTMTGEFPDPVKVYFGSVEATSLSQTASRIVALAPASSQAGAVSVRLVRNGSAVLTVPSGFTYQAANNNSYTPPPSGTGGGTSDPGNGSNPDSNPDAGTGSGGGTGAPSTPNTGSPVTTTPNTGTPDSGTPATTQPGGTPDSATPDSGTPDSGTPDSGTPDSGTPDSGTPDSGTPDSGTPATTQPGGSAATDRSRQARPSVDSERIDLGGGRTGVRVAGNPLASAPACRSNTCGAQNS